MKPQNATDYSLVCVGRYTRTHIEELYLANNFGFIATMFSLILSNMPEHARKRRSDLCVIERGFSHRFKRPANLFEILWFAKKYPEFPFLYGSIECSQDPYLDSFIKEVGIKPGVIVLSFDSELDKLTLKLEEYDDKDRDTQFVLVVPV